MKQAENHTIYTIGHSTHSFAEFLEMLRSFDIKILKAFSLGVPQWLIDLHGFFGMVVK